MDIILTLIFSGILLLVLVNTIYAYKARVSTTPSSPQTRRKIIDHIAQQKGDCADLTILELGSGWGGLFHKLRLNFPKARIIGYEISPVPLFISRLRSFFDRRGNGVQTNHDFMNQPVDNADIIVCYLSPSHMRLLATKFNSELKEGTLIYSQGFPIDGWTSTHVLPTFYAIEKEIYCYEMGKSNVALG